MTKRNDTTAQNEDRVDLSRRHLLAGTAGLTLGAIAAPTLVAAEDHAAMPMAGTVPT
ncbi:MAG: hypothetical protein JNK01_11040, partial [Devosia sp.]|nr:hypothetical protein [Devosia sp.]